MDLSSHNEIDELSLTFRHSDVVDVVDIKRRNHSFERSDDGGPRLEEGSPILFISQLCHNCLKKIMF